MKSVWKNRFLEQLSRTAWKAIFKLHLPVYYIMKIILALAEAATGGVL